MNKLKYIKELLIIALTLLLFTFMLNYVMYQSIKETYWIQKPLDVNLKVTKELGVIK